ncbi:MAG: NAD(P)-binding protein [Frankiales bacterium]|nr:NAD(P)-binding protein [Frankiales bacterium]
MDPRHAILFEPVRIGPKTLPNRFYQVPHASGFGSHRPRTHAAFRGVKAEGGWGGVNVDYAPVSLDADDTPTFASDAWDADDVRRLGVVVEAIHAHGSLAGIELYHGGAESKNGESRNVRVAPTQSRSLPMWSSLAKTATADDLARIRRDFVTAAVRARDVGFDIVYVYGAHGYLMTQLLSPDTNLRNDAYGGSLENRGRFWREVLESVRDAVGDDCAVAVRLMLHGREGWPGIQVDEMLEFVRSIDPLVDLVDVTTGSWPENSGTSRYHPQGHERPWTSRVREATSKPIVGVGRYTDPDLMASLVRSGELDLIGAARPAIADPFLPAKIREGRLDEIRECTGANVCILREETFGQIGCLQNATAGEEYRRGWHPESFDPPADPDRAVLVVGGGPAGMECALVLGRRGFAAVHLVEAGPELGGKLRWTRRLPTLGDWGRVIDHRVVGLSKLPQVQVVLGRRLSVADVLDYGADTVVVATGSSWCDDGTQAHHGPPVLGAAAALTPERVMAGERPAPGRVVVYDADGYYVGVGIAELLATEGREVVVVTPFDRVSPVSDDTLEGDMLRRHLHDIGITAVTGAVLHEVTSTGATGRTTLGDPWSLDAAGVVLVTQQRSDDELYSALLADPEALAAAGIRAVHAIGDAVAPRMPSEAVFDGHRLARELERDDPMAPSPWLRERPGV